MYFIPFLIVFNETGDDFRDVPEMQNIGIFLISLLVLVRLHFLRFRLCNHKTTIYYYFFYILFSNVLTQAPVLTMPFSFIKHSTTSHLAPEQLSSLSQAKSINWISGKEPFEPGEITFFSCNKI